MREIPKFFVPDAAPGEYETIYARAAESCGCAVPPLGQRVYSITWIHSGEEWTATVGECLSGVRHKKAARGKKASVVNLGDPAKVQMIFRGDQTYRVVTNWAYGSRWVNPFLTGVPLSVILFT